MYVVSDGKERTTLIQCTNCGKVYEVSREVSIEKLYVASICPRCGCRIGLNCGQTIEDLYELSNINIDPRYF